jgi:hypothetical protein
VIEDDEDDDPVNTELFEYASSDYLVGEKESSRRVVPSRVLELRAKRLARFSPY